MKKFILGLFSLVLVFALFCVGYKDNKVEAWGVGPSIVITDGCSIRTNDPVGIKFSATVSGFGDNAVYGFAFVKGEYNRADMVAKLKAGKTATIDVTPVEGVISASIVDIPEEGYLTDLTAIAYVKIDDEYKYATADSCTRNIYEVAKVAEENGQSSAFTSGIVTNSEYTVTYDTVNALISDSSYTKVYPAAGETVQIGNYGLSEYWTTSIRLSKIFFVTKAQIAADSNGYSYTYRVGLTYDASIEEYVVTQILTGSGAGVVDTRTVNNSDVYLLVSTDYAAGLTSLKKLALNDVVYLNFNHSSSSTGAVTWTAIQYKSFTLKYSKTFVKGQDATLPTITKEFYQFEGWLDSTSTKVTTVSSAMNLTASWKSTFEMRYYANGGSLSGDYTINDNYVLSDAIASTSLDFANGSYYSYYQTNIIYYTNSGASADGWTYGHKIGLNYNSTLNAYEVVQKINGGTALNTSNRTSEYYLITNDAYAAGKQWYTSLQIGQYITFTTDIKTLSGNGNANIANTHTLVNNAIYIADGVGTITLPTPTKSLYKFAGWYENADYSGSPITTYTVTSGQYKCLYAKWTAVVYTGKIVTSNGVNSTGGNNSISADGLTVTYTALSSGADGFVAFRCYEDGVAMTMGPSLWTLSTSNSGVISAYSSYSCVGLVKGTGTVTMTLTNKANPDIVIQIVVTVEQATN